MTADSAIRARCRLQLKSVVDRLWPLTSLRHTGVVSTSCNTTGSPICRHTSHAGIRRSHLPGKRHYRNQGLLVKGALTFTLYSDSSVSPVTVKLVLVGKAFQFVSLGPRNSSPVGAQATR